MFQLLCVLSFVFICVPPEVIFHSRVIGACPVTTDCVVAMGQCENNVNNNGENTRRQPERYQVRDEMIIHFDGNERIRYY